MDSHRRCAYILYPNIYTILEAGDGNRDASLRGEGQLGRDGLLHEGACVMWLDQIVLDLREQRKERSS